MRRLALAAVAATLAFLTDVRAEPNNDIVAYCRQTAPSFAAMASCIDTERKARNLQSCLDALGSWPRDVPCPTEWLQMAVRNIRENLPCQMHEVAH